MSLVQIFDKYPDRRYLMFGGKGGLGKTTFSAATAYYLAQKGKRVLVFSVDPQASLSDIFERDIFGRGNIEIMPNLFACEVDADKRIKDYQEEIRQKIITMYGMEKITGLREQMREYDKAIATMKREEETEEDQIYNELLYIKEHIGQSSKIMTDKKKTAFFFVLTPEEMTLIDTEKAAGLFAKYDVPLAGYVVNRVIKRELLNQNIPVYLQNRIAMQAKALEMIDEKFGNTVLSRVPEFDSEIKGLQTIKKLAEEMFGEKL